MVNNIDKLRTEVDDITKSLNELKDNVTLSEEEKKKQAEELKPKVEEIKQKIMNEIKELEKNVEDLESIQKKEEAEALLNNLIDADITDLYTSITSSPDATTQSPTQTQTEDKSIFIKAKDRVGEQRDDVRNKDKRKFGAEGGKNLLRTAGFLATGIGGVALAFKGVKKLWNRAFSSNEEEEEEVETKPKKKKKKKGFWNRWYGKVIKLGAIGTGTYWLGKQFGWWGKEEGATGRDSDKEKYESYQEFKKKPENKEKVEKYEDFGDKIDTLFEGIYDRELKAGYQDPLEMDRISKKESGEVIIDKGIVPYCLDNQFKNVEKILGQNSSFEEALHNGLNAMVGFIKDKGLDFLKVFSENFLEFLPSRGPFKNMAGSLSDKIDKWKVENSNAEKEMQYFFRQSIRVQTYLFEKKEQLAKAIAKNAANVYGESESKILKDKDKYEKYIEKNSDFQNFLNNPMHLSIGVLSKYNIFDTQIGKELDEAVKDIDKDRDEILGVTNREKNPQQKDILQIIYEKKEKNEQLTADNDQALEKVCNNVIKNIDEEIMDAIEESARNIYGDLFRIGDANLREYLDKSGLDLVLKSCSKTISDMRLDLIAGRLSNEKKIQLASTLNDILALKKEAEMGKMTIEKDYDEYGNWFLHIPGFLAGSLGNLWKGMVALTDKERKEGAEYLLSAGLGTGLIITSLGVVKGVTKGKWGVAKVGAAIMTLPVSVPVGLPSYGAYKLAMHFKPVRRAVNVHNPLKYTGAKGAETLLKHLKDDQISLEDAGIIVEKKCLGRRSTKEGEQARKEMYGLTDDLKEAKTVKNIDFRCYVLDTIIKKVGGAAGSTRLEEIKKDAKLYQELVDGFDNSEELRLAIKGNKSIDELRRLSFKANIPEAIKNNRHLLLLLSDIESMEDVIKVSGGEQQQIEKQLRRLYNFREELITLDAINLEKTWKLIGAFKGNKTLEFAIKQLSILQALEGKTIKSSLLDAQGNPITKNLDDILKNFDFDELKRIKNEILALKLDGVTGDAIDGLADTFKMIKGAEIQKLFGNNIGDVFKAVKKLVTIFTKVS